MRGQAGGDLLKKTQGYIMALEDVIDALVDKEHGDGCVALEQAMDAVSVMLSDARSTLDAMTEKKEPDDVRL